MGKYQIFLHYDLKINTKRCSDSSFSHQLLPVPTSSGCLFKLRAENLMESINRGKLPFTISDYGLGN